MTRFDWDETALLEFFGVVPIESSEYGRDLVYRITDGVLTLVFGVNVVSSDCSVCLFVEGSERAVFEAAYLGSPGARVVNDKRGHYLELGSAGSFMGNYDGSQPLAHGLRIFLFPQPAIVQFGSD